MFNSLLHFSLVYSLHAISLFQAPFDLVHWFLPRLLTHPQSKTTIFLFIFQLCDLITINKINGSRYGYKMHQIAEQMFYSVWLSTALGWMNYTNKSNNYGIHRELSLSTIAIMTLQSPKMLNKLESIKYSNYYWYMEYLHGVCVQLWLSLRHGTARKYV